jgi:CBS domain-containing protein
VADVMQREVLTVRLGSALTEAAKVMTREHVSGLPVLDAEDKLVGILTEADFLSAMDIHGGSAIQDLFDSLIRKRRGRKKMGTIVEDIMTKDPVCIRSDDTLQQALQLMNKNRIKRLVITNDDNHVEGIVSRADLIKLYSMH